MCIENGEEKYDKVLRTVKTITKYPCKMVFFFPEIITWKKFWLFLLQYQEFLENGVNLKPMIMISHMK